MSNGWAGERRTGASDGVRAAPPPTAPRSVAARIRTTAWTVGAAALSLFCTIMTAGLAGFAHTPGWNVAAGCVLNLAAGVALIWRHQHPWRVLALAVAGPLFFATDATAALIALFAVAAAVRDRRLVVSAGAVWIACGVSLTYDAVRRRDYSVLTIGSARPRDGQVPEWNLPLWLPWVVATVLVVVVVGLALLRRARSDLVQAETVLDVRTRESEAMRHQMLRADERARIARDMHDTLAATLSRISLTAGGLQVNSGDGPERVANTASLIQRTAHDGLDELRRIVGVLRAGDGAATAGMDRGLDSIGDLLTAGRAVGVRVTHLTDLAPGQVGPLTGSISYRVVREAVTNAQRHAPGAPVLVAVRGGPDDGLSVEVRNSLPGAAEDTGIVGTGTGLRGLREQATEVGGSFCAERVGDEFVVTCLLPFFS
ncbi:sensor histidine kinase [Williamsia sterculiae]|nr:histidine kinase [Williamsia sterculiae]